MVHTAHTNAVKITHVELMLLTSQTKFVLQASTLHQRAKLLSRSVKLLSCGSIRLSVFDSRIPQRFCRLTHVYRENLVRESDFCVRLPICDTFCEQL